MARIISSLQSFLNEIRQGYQNGNSLVPFVGAGVSVAAGIPATTQLNEYLSLCVAMALGLDNDTRTFIPRWHPKLAPWPEISGNWKQRAWMANKTIKEWAFKNPKKGSEELPFVLLAREAFGDLSDWRLSLLFLSRISPDRSLSRKNERERPLELCDGDPHIIDSFFHHLTKDKLPSMPHRMLAHFAATLRTRVTLTLNFDDLLEQAYREAGLEPTIFEVHHAAGLPPWGLLGKGQAIVKMHGGKYGLRADLSLDREPTEQEKRQFRSYLIGRDWTEGTRQNVQASHQHAALLLMGISGRDRRVTLLIDDALEHIPKLKIFWIPYSEDAKNQIAKRFTNQYPNGSELCIFQYSFLGTLLWEIYQKIHRCIPSGGAVFPVSWRLPLVPESESPKESSQDTAFAEWLKTDPRKICLLTSPSNPEREWGVSAFSWEWFRKLSSENHCLWLDGADLKGAQDIGIRLFQAACNVLGCEHEIPPTLSPTAHAHLCDEVNSILSRSGREWFLFLNLRTKIGYNADLFGSPPIDDPQSSPPESTTQVSKCLFDFRYCSDFLRRLHIRVLNLSIICLAWDKDFEFQADAEPIPFGTPGPKANWAVSRLKKVLPVKLFEGTEKRLLISLSLLSPVRHETALAARAIFPNESYEEIFQQIGAAIQKWRSKKFLRLKPGHFLWMHPMIKDALRKEMVPYFQPASRAELHTALADWCMTFYYSTRDPLAAFQAVYHRCRVAELVAHKEFPPDNAPLSRLRSSLSEACNHLELAKASILTAGNSLDTRRFLEGFRVRFSALEALCMKCDSKTRLRNRDFFLLSGIKLLTFSIGYYRDIGDLAMVLSCCDDLDNFRKASPRAGKDVDRFRAARGIELERAVLNISSRSYRAAEVSLKTLIAPLCFTTATNLNRVLSPRYKEIESAVFFWTDRAKWGAGVKRESRFEARKIAFSALRRLIEVYLLQVELRELLANCGIQNKHSRSTDFLQRAQKAYRIARMLPRFISEEEFGELRTERSRLHSIFAGILACSNDYSGVQRHINEAEIAINHIPESEEAIGKCVVDLRRIYCNLRRIDSALGMTLKWTLQGCQARAPKTTKSKVGEIRSDLDQVELWLIRVEARMIRGRKSLWWWLTLRRYQMVALLYREILRFWQRDGDAFGDESGEMLAYASYQDTQRAIHLLVGAANRTMFDPFQLARILHAGLSFAQLLQAQVKIDLLAKEELSRIWRRALSAGLAQLREVEARKEKSRLKEYCSQSEINKYVRFVRKGIDNFVGDWQDGTNLR